MTPDAFRAHCRRWLAANVPSERPASVPSTALELVSREALDFLVAFQRDAYDAGLVGCDYPEAYGGGGHHGFQRIANEEMARAEAPVLPNLVGLGMAAPTLLHFGTEEQKRRFLPPILSGEELWCQGFSEPEAGSDLANVQTFAEQTGDGWVVSGHKVWTSLAHFAKWMILLARTDRAEKHRGLTYFVAPVEGAEAVTVRPLVKMTGGRGFNEVLFEELELGDDMRLGGVGEGWRVAMTTLAHERGAAGLVTPDSGASDNEVGVRQLVALARRRGLTGDPRVRDALAALAIRERAYAETTRRARLGLAGPERLALQDKLVHSELQQDLAALGCELTGSTVVLEEEPSGTPWPHEYMASFGITIAAGSSEIQRNILGERVLGLPKSR